MLGDFGIGRVHGCAGCAFIDWLGGGQGEDCGGKESCERGDGELHLDDRSGCDWDGSLLYEAEDDHVWDEQAERSLKV